MLLQIGSAVDEVLSAYSVPVSDKSTPTKDNSSVMSVSKIASDQCDDENQLQSNRSAKRYGSGIRIKKRIAHSGAAVAKAVGRICGLSSIQVCLFFLSGHTPKPYEKVEVWF